MPFTVNCSSGVVTLQVWYFHQKKKKRVMGIVLDKFINFLLVSSLKYFSVVMSVFLFAIFIGKEADTFAQLPFVQS